MELSSNPNLRPVPQFREQLKRTVSAWGSDVQADLSRLRVGVIGAGSVGSIVAEGLARMGLQELVIVDFDRVETVNLDRLLHAQADDVGYYKAELVARSIRTTATAEDPQIEAIVGSVCSSSVLDRILDLDVLFSCVDRPWGRAVMNLVAYAHFIPVVDGGVLVDPGRNRMRGAEWRAHIGAPTRKCLECLGQYDPGLVQMERDGLLEDSSYMANLPSTHPLKRNENVFAFATAAASAQMMQLLSMVVAPAGIADTRAQLFHFATGRMDVDESTCQPNCLYSGSLLGRGDDVPQVTG
jgi:hypothetical protein